MKCAREMFKKLDFYVISEKPLIYRQDDGGYITEYLFNQITQGVQIKEYEEYNNNLPQGGTSMYIEHIKAIQQQIKELNWESDK